MGGQVRRSLGDQLHQSGLFLRSSFLEIFSSIPDEGNLHSWLHKPSPSTGPLCQAWGPVEASALGTIS